MDALYLESVELLKKLISTKSFSREEDATADILSNHMKMIGVENINRLNNNIWAYNKYFDSEKPTILLNSHHDTVKPNGAYTRDPFAADVEGDKLYGLGSNDAGASLVSLIALFKHFYNRSDLRYNFCIALTAEEEVGGFNGMESIVSLLGNLDFAIVGEPTLMQLAIAERGLMVIDCVAVGKSGHAAREEGDNAIFRAIEDINWLNSYKFEKVSSLFGQVKMSTTIINAGTQHNVVPAECSFTVDVRVTEMYTNEEVLFVIKENLASNVKARSTRLRSSSIDPSHPIVKAGEELGRTTYGSPTTSDQVFLSVPSLKIGVGDSARSHSADEFVYLTEIKDGIELYIKMLDKIL